MPFYEFYCAENHRIYTFYARSMALAGKVPRCPDHPEWRLKKLPSRFSVTGRHKERTEADEAGGEDDPFAGIADEQLERVMGEFERELDGGDGGDADPRLMGRLMRRLSDVAGRPLAGPMAEMVARMEKGEDPDRLEAEYGDALDGEGAAGLFEAARKALRANREPIRQPGVYEMEEWIGPMRRGGRGRKRGAEGASPA
jgi:hypothetical protein